MIKSIYIMLDKENSHALIEDIKEFFSRLNLFSEIFLLSKNFTSDFDKIFLITKELSIFLKNYGFYRVNLNIVHPFFNEAEQYYVKLNALIQPFNVEGYVHQGTPRLILLPIIVVNKRSSKLMNFLAFLEEKFMMPGLYTRRPFASDRVERIFIEPICAKETIDTFGYYHIFYDLLDKIDYSDDRIIKECGSNLIMGKDGQVYPCFRSYWLGLSKKWECPECKYEVLKGLKNHYLSKETDMGSLHVRMAFSYLEKNNFSYALRHLKEALYLCPKEERPNLYFYTGLCQANLRAYNEAIKTFKKSIKDYNTAFYLGFCHLNKKDYKKAVVYFKKALRLKPYREDTGRILFYLGLCHKSLDDYKKAIEALNKARMFDNGVEINNLLGICYFKSRDYQNAIRFFKNVVSLDPSSAIDYANICICLKALGRWKDAIKYCKKSLNLDPSIDFAQKALRELEKISYV